MDTPRFYSSAGDGPKLPESAVSYRSFARSEAIVQEMDRYLTAKGYRRSEDGTYQQERSVVSVEVSQDGGQSRVIVRDRY